MNLSIKGYKSVSVGVIGLLSSCGPPAIIQLSIRDALGTVATKVTKGVVDSVKTLSPRPVSEIGKEIVERKPSFAHCNSSSAIVSKAFYIGIFTALSHRVPYFINASVAHAVLFACLAGHFSLQTAAALSPATCYRSLLNYSFLSAVASASPSRNRIHFRFCDNDKPPKSLSNDSWTDKFEMTRSTASVNSSFVNMRWISVEKFTALRTLKLHLISFLTCQVSGAGSTILRGSNLF